MSGSRQIKEGIQRLAKTFGTDYAFIVVGSVVSVDEQKRTCKIEVVSGINAEEIEGVLLQAEPNDGFLLVPKAESTVKVLFSNKQAPFVVHCSEIDKMVVIVNKTEFVIQDGTIKLNGDAFGGVIKVDDLKTQYDAMLTAFKAAVAAGFSALSGLDSGASLAAFNSAASSIQNLNKTTLQNTTVKHGNG